MYLDALEFLEEERDAFRPFEALADLDDGQLAVPVEAAHGWSGRQLMGHILAWQEVALSVATELAVNETSPAKARADADWDTRGGEVVNAEIDAAWAALPMDELRDRFATIPGQLRGLSDGRPREPLAQAPRPSAVLPHRDDRPLRGPPRRPRGDPGRGRSMTLRDLLVDAAGQLDDVTTELGSDGAVTWSRAGRAVRVGLARWHVRRVRPRSRGRSSRGPDAGRRTVVARDGLGRLCAGGCRRPRRGPSGRLAGVRLSPPRPARLTLSD